MIIIHLLNKKKKWRKRWRNNRMNRMSVVLICMILIIKVGMRSRIMRKQMKIKRNSKEREAI